MNVDAEGNHIRQRPPRALHRHLEIFEGAGRLQIQITFANDVLMFIPADLAADVNNLAALGHHDLGEAILGAVEQGGLGNGVAFLQYARYRFAQDNALNPLPPLPTLELHPTIGEVKLIYRADPNAIPKRSAEAGNTIDTVRIGRRGFAVQAAGIEQVVIWEAVRGVNQERYLQGESVASKIRCNEYRHEIYEEIVKWTPTP